MPNFGAILVNIVQINPKSLRQLGFGPNFSVMIETGNPENFRAPYWTFLRQLKFCLATIKNSIKFLPAKEKKSLKKFKIQQTSYKDMLKLFLPAYANFRKIFTEFL